MTPEEKLNLLRGTIATPLADPEVKQPQTVINCKMKLIMLFKH